MKPVELPTEDLKRLGEKMQQSIVLTGIRAARLKPSRLKVRAERTLKNATALFQHVTDTVQTTVRLTGFMEKALGVTVDDIFGFTGHERAARGATYTGMALVIRSIEKTIDELAAINSAMDKEAKNGEKTS